jgi:hypothetical protein
MKKSGDFIGLRNGIFSSEPAAIFLSQAALRATPLALSNRSCKHDQCASKLQKTISRCPSKRLCLSFWLRTLRGWPQRIFAAFYKTIWIGFPASAEPLAAF